MKKWAFFVFAGLTTMIAWGVPAEGAETMHNHTEGWKELWNHLLWDIGVIGAIFGAVSFYLLLKYKRKSENEIGSLEKFSTGKMLAWALVPAFIFLADDFYLAAGGWKLWIDQRNPPENALEVKVTGRSWGWDFEYPDGAMSSSDVEFDENGNVTGVDGEGLVVPHNKPVVLRMTSNDVIHGFFIPDFRIKEDVMPGRVTFIWFMPDKIGEHVYTCTEYCGVNHSRMYGKVKVVSESDFEQWSGKNQG